MTDKRFKLRLSKLSNGMITDTQKREDLYFDKEFLDATLPKVNEWLNELAEENQQLKIENVYLTLKNKQWEIFSEQSSYPFGSLLYLQAAAIPFKDIYFIERDTEDNSKIIIYVKSDYNKKEIEKFKEEHLPLGIEYEIFSIKEIKGDIKVIK